MPPASRASRAAGLACALLLAAGCGGGEEGGDAPGYRPPLAANLLLVSIDTARADHFGCYGYHRPTSPAIDTLAAEGQRFEAAYTVMPTTLPAHAAMLTSQYPRQMGVRSNLGVLSEGELTLAERLRARGFATAAFVSAKVLHAETRIDQGFDTFRAPEVGQWRGNHARSLAGEWLGEHATERFFCFVHLYDPHVPYDPGEEDRAAFDVQSEHPLPPVDVVAFMASPERLTPDVVEDSIDAYDAEIAFADRQVGMLLRQLENFGLLEKTVVIVLSDHGETFDELAAEYGYAFDHGEFLHPRELRVPFLLRAPAAFGFPPRAIAQPISLLDVLPTALELCGVPCEAPHEGRSLVPLLAGGEVEGATIVAERHGFVTPPNAWMQGEERALLHDPWLLVRSDGRGTRLFHLDDDPLAIHDLSATAAEEATRLESRLERWLETRTPRADRVDPAAIGSERDETLRGLGYADGG